MARLATPSLVGSGVFNLLTTGMYDTPLAVYREYIQNSFDAIQSFEPHSKGRVDIRVDPTRRCVTVRDNGPGLSRQDAERDLVAVAQSRKRRGTDIGFRGIGRLSGLAFAESVVFRTRSAASQRVVELVWDGDTLRRHATLGNLSPNEIIKASVDVAEFDGCEWPEHFFEVEIREVARHAAGDILNRDAVRSYIAEVCPVPIGEDFPFAGEVRRMFKGSGVNLSGLDIQIEGDNEPIKRPFGSSIIASEEKEHPFTECECVYVPALDGEKPAALGWMAHTDYFGAIPKSLSIRGLRAREGNLQIGDERAFDHLFPEGRFNRWCVGEIHVIDPRILPNGRRDYFEPGPHTRNLENQLEAVARRVSERCRKASTGRYGLRKLLTELEQSETIFELASAGYLKAPDSRTLVQDALERLGDVREKSAGVRGWTSSEWARLDALEGKLKGFSPKRGRSAFGKVHNSEIDTYQKVFRVLAETSPTPQAAMRTIEGVLASA